MTRSADASSVVQALQRPVWQTPVLPVTDELWIHPKARRLPFPYTNTLINLRDGGLLTIEGDQACISHDDGVSWLQYPLFSSSGIKPAFEYALVRSVTGAIVLIYMDTATARFAWDDEKHEVKEWPRRDTCCIRSFDEGRTWSSPVLVADHCGCMIQGLATTGGRIVVPTQRMLAGPNRWGQSTCVSDDDGHTWTESNIVDVGGHGHHDGGFEASLVELRDGRLWMLLRTNLDRFWQAFSRDGGLTWGEPEPTDIDASSSPAWLTRLASGRLMLAWNRLYPDGLSPEQQARWDRAGGDCNSCRPVASWHRHELSIAFSEDEGKRWSSPTVLIRDQRMAYPTILERRPGQIYVTTRFSQRIAVEIFERDFVAA